MCQTLVQTDTGSVVLDTVFLQPDTLIEERIVYIEYTGTPDVYSSLGVSPTYSYHYFSNNTQGNAYGFQADFQYQTGRLGFAAGMNLSSCSWDNRYEFSYYSYSEYEEEYEYVLDSFGRVNGQDTIWENVTEMAQRTVTDSVLNDSVLIETVNYIQISFPLTVSYRLNSGFFFADIFASVVPQVYLNKHYSSQSSSGMTYETIQSKYGIGAGAGLSLNYLLHPRWIVSAAVQYRHAFAQASPKEKALNSSLSFGLGVRYLFFQE